MKVFLNLLFSSFVLVLYKTEDVSYENFRNCMLPATVEIAPEAFFRL